MHIATMAARARALSIERRGKAPLIITSPNVFHESLNGTIAPILREWCVWTGGRKSSSSLGCSIHCASTWPMTTATSGCSSEESRGERRHDACDDGRDVWRPHSPTRAPDTASDTRSARGCSRRGGHALAGAVTHVMGLGRGAVPARAPTLRRGRVPSPPTPLSAVHRRGQTLHIRRGLRLPLP